MNRPRAYHHGDLRAELLERAEATLRTSGVDSLTLRQLARETGVSHAAPNRHFRDKQALLDALALVGFERLAALYADAAIDGTFSERVFATARIHLRFAVDNPALLTLMFSRKNSADVGTELAAAMQQTFASAITLMAEGQSSGEVVPGDPVRLSMLLAAAVHGLADFVVSGFLTEEVAEELLRETITNFILGFRLQS
ncbi:TetR/AcrR family transcriptional regulator [Nocardia asteroides]|uniref:TetR/AcrR family transcriptional regulator n=1 Tax=Nocardia asteroides TaxID=1824 RepID=UPI0022B845C8|nr:TetR/AcrR family transcriptional regulator [Nocardia asteroides]